MIVAVLLRFLFIYMKCSVWTVVMEPDHLQICVIFHGGMMYLLLPMTVTTECEL